MGGKKGQISTEYLVLAGFIVFLLIGVLGLGMFYSGQVSDSIKFNQLESFSDSIISSSEKVIYRGEPSKLTVKAYLPSGVRNITITQNEIIFEVSTNSGVSKIAYSSEVAIEGYLSSEMGLKTIEISAVGNKAVISET